MIRSAGGAATEMRTPAPTRARDGDTHTRGGRKPNGNILDKREAVGSYERSIISSRVAQQCTHSLARAECSYGLVFPTHHHVYANPGSETAGVKPVDGSHDRSLPGMASTTTHDLDGHARVHRCAHQCTDSHTSSIHAHAHAPAYAESYVRTRVLGLTRPPARPPAPRTHARTDTHGAMVSVPANLL